MLLTTTWDSNLRVYDEEDPEETFMLRKSTGGHFKDDISSLDFNAHLSLIATGSRSGIVCVWDFETNKLEGICLGQKRTVSSLCFVKEYPVLISMGICGIICIWGVRPCPYEMRHICIGRFINLGWDGENFTNIPIHSGFVRLIEKNKAQESSNAQSSSHKFKKKASVSSAPEEENLKCTYDESDSFLEEAYFTDFDHNNNEKIEKFVTEFTKIREDNDPEEGTIYNSNYQSHFLKYQPKVHDQNDPNPSPKVFLIFGDEKGFIKHWDISAFFTSESIHDLTTTPPKFAKVPSMKDKLSYNAKRK